MELLFDDIYKVYRDAGSSGWGYSYLLKRKEGNIFLPRMAREATISAEIPLIEAVGGIAKIYVTDYHFAGKGLPQVAEHFDAPVFCSEVEKAKVGGRGLKNLQPFAYEENDLEQNWRVIPTPGHTTGGVCYLWKRAKRKLLFTGDFLYYSGKGWIAGNKKLAPIRQSLERLRALDFDVLIGCGDDDLGKPYIDLTQTERVAFFDTLMAAYNS